MCLHPACGDPNNTRPWCRDCDGHITESSVSEHQRNTGHAPDTKAGRMPL